MPRVAITIDDLPFTRYTQTDVAQRREALGLMLDALDKFHVQCLGFAVGQWVVGAEPEEVLNAFRSSGHVIGNHGYRHRAFEDLALNEFESDLLASHEKLSPWLGEKPAFRFPFLRLGVDGEKKNRALEMLRRRGYQHAPVTIDIEDWRLDAEYAKNCAGHGKLRLNGYAERFSRFVIRRAEYFENLAHQRLGRSPAHMLLLHLNRTTARFLFRVLRDMQSENWIFVSPAEALSDPIYRMPSVLDREDGVSWLYHV